MRYRNIVTGDEHDSGETPSARLDRSERWVRIPDGVLDIAACPTCGRPTVELLDEGVLARADEAPAPTRARPASSGKHSRRPRPTASEPAAE